MFFNFEIKKYTEKREKNVCYNVFDSYKLKKKF